ncbi:MAG: SUMO-targeted ubiquitin ligase complex subunit slx8 [Caeruleum heppii]|nr:MAG: SUMO-targeted ubiquitin ligase complex subunit slx8 [Caeruleum heppii]
MPPQRPTKRRRGSNGDVALQSPAVSTTTAGPSTSLNGWSTVPDLAPATSNPHRRHAPSSTRVDVGKNDSPQMPPEEIDLREIDSDHGLSSLLQRQRQEQIRAQQTAAAAEPPTTLSTLQCVICMEPPSNLTSTHCGHLFCHTCLMESLMAAHSTQSRCPVCRTEVLRMPKGNRGGEGKHWTVLELKVARIGVR